VRSYPKAVGEVTLTATDVLWVLVSVQKTFIFLGVLSSEVYAGLLNRLKWRLIEEYRGLDLESQIHKLVKRYGRASAPVTLLVHWFLDFFISLSIFLDMSTFPILGLLTLLAVFIGHVLSSKAVNLVKDTDIERVRVQEMQYIKPAILPPQLPTIDRIFQFNYMAKPDLPLSRRAIIKLANTGKYLDTAIVVVTGLALVTVAWLRLFEKIRAL